MAIFSCPAAALFNELETEQDVVILDVRNEKDFARFHIESSKPFKLCNVSYYRFMETEEEAVAAVPRGPGIRITCAKEGSAKYVAEILDKHGFANVAYLAGGIKSWGNMLVPKLVAAGQGYELHQFIRPGKASCSYGLICGREMMLFDPSRNVDFYLAFAKEKGAEITKIFETHLQADYISGSSQLLEQCGAALHANAEDFGGAQLPFIPLTDGEFHSFANGGPQVQVIFTPGHTPGSTSYIIDGKYMLSGDTVFLASVGRPDLGGQAEAWAVRLYATISRILREFDRSLQVLPGHYMNWQEADARAVFTATLAEVIERNKHIYSIGTEADFIHFIKENIRQQPEEYARIRLINAGREQVSLEEADLLDLGKNECAATAHAQAKTAQPAAN
ncbi:Rhodanese domain-containing protein [Candidatus Electronema halotolerans]|jgi:glyoxylase-like metal-dependent hydrolase (beta-lactamase superfamily II)